MISWTLGQWICYSIIWLWATWVSKKAVNILEGDFNGKILAIYPHYKIPKWNRGIPAWPLGFLCVWLMSLMAESKDFVSFELTLTFIIFLCFLSIFPAFIITSFGWLIANNFRIAVTLADAAAYRWKSIKPYELD